MIETVRFYRASAHVFDYPLTNPLQTLCDRPCFFCGANSGEWCAAQCSAAKDQLWESHYAIAQCRMFGAACAFCGGLPCVAGVFTVQLSGGVTRQYRINDYGLAALGAFTVYRTYIYTGEWPQGSPANVQAKREFPNATCGRIGREQNPNH